MPFAIPSAVSIINDRNRQVAMNSYKQDHWLSYKERSTSQRHLSAGFSCGARDPDWDFIDQQALKELRPEGANAAYKFASEENPMQLRNDNGGMDDDEFDEDDEGVDCVYPYHAGRLIGKTSAEKAMSDVPECESGSSCEGSVMEDEMLDVMDSAVPESFNPVVFAQEDSGNMMMEMEMEMQMTAAANSNNKRKRWADDDDCVQQHQQQNPFAAAGWGGFPDSAKRVRVQG